MNYPHIRLHLEVDNMVHSIVQHISDHTGELEETIKKHVEAELAAFNIGEHVKRIAPKMIQDAIEQAVKQGIQLAIWNSGIQHFAQNQVTKALKGVTKAKK